MSGPSLDLLAPHFERLLALPASARAEALTDIEITLGRDVRDALESLLKADADGGDLTRAISDAALRTAQGAELEGNMLGAYRVLREIGAGGMGTVFLAQRADGAFEQQVAIKVMRGFPTREGMARLRQERQILATLDHPHIARLVDGGETAQGQPYLVMEFVDGVSIVDYVEQNRSTVAERLALFDGILAAVQHAHQRLIVHRDLKPSNVLVRRDGVPKLLDFGVAKLLDDAQRDTSTRVWTYGYASPEQMAGRAITTASDVYSLGVLLRHLLTGSSSALPETSLLLDAELRGIIALATADDPAARYPSAEALREDLARYRTGRPVRAAPDTRWYRARKFVGRHRVAALLVVAAVLATAGFVWRLGAERSRAVAAEHAADAARKRAEDDAALAREAVRYLGNTFEAAAPQHARGKPLSAAELLDAGRSRLDADLGARPALKQRVQRLFGTLYVALGANREAIELLEPGTADVVPADAADALAIARDLDTLAGALARADRGEDALAKAERAADLRAKYAPFDPNERRESQRELGYAHYTLQDYAKAEAELKQALALYDAPGARPDPEFRADAANTLIAVYYENNRTDEADALSAQALADARRDLPADSPSLVDLLRSRARVVQAQGRPDAAEPLMREALELQRRVVGDSGTTLGSIENDYGVVLNDLGRYRAALEHFELAERLGADATDAPRDAAIGWNNIASVRESAGDYPGALALFEKVVAVFRKERPPEAPDRRNMESNYARTLALSGRTAQARELLQDLIVRTRAADGDDSLAMGMLAYRLGLTERIAGNHARALELIAQAQRTLASHLPAEHKVFAHLAGQRGLSALARGDAAAAETAFAESLRIADGKSGSNAVDLAVFHARHAQALAALGQREAARTELAAALPALRDNLLPAELARAEAERTAKALGL